MIAAFHGFLLNCSERVIYNKRIRRYRAIYSLFFNLRRKTKTFIKFSRPSHRFSFFLPV